MLTYQLTYRIERGLAAPKVWFVYLYRGRSLYRVFVAKALAAKPLREVIAFAGIGWDGKGVDDVMAVLSVARDECIDCGLIDP